MGPFICSKRDLGLKFDMPLNPNKQTNVLRTSIDLIKENGFTLKKQKTCGRYYPAETITDADNAAMIKYFSQIQLLKQNSE